MDKLDQYRYLIERILTEYAQIRYSYGNLENRVLFDRERDQHAIISLGWTGKHREHGVVAHLEIKNGKIWIQEDNTESGIATDLEAAGIPKGDIVLGFRHPQLRPYTGYAVRSSRIVCCSFCNLYSPTFGLQGLCSLIQCDAAYRY